MSTTIGTRRFESLLRTAVTGVVVAQFAACGPPKASADPSEAAVSPTAADASTDAASAPANPRRAPLGTVAKCGAKSVERVRDIREVGEDGPFNEPRRQSQGIADSLEVWDVTTLAPPALGRDELTVLGGMDGAIRAEGVDVEYTFDAEGLAVTARVFSAGSEEHVEQTWTYVRRCSTPSTGAVLQLMRAAAVELPSGGGRQTLGQTFTAAVAPLDEPPEVECGPAGGGGWACSTAVGGMHYSVTVVAVGDHWLKIDPDTVDVIDDD